MANLSLARNLKAGMRIPFDPAGFRSLRLIKRTPAEMEMTARGGFGSYHVRLTILESPGTLLRCTTTLTPCAELKIEAMPRDMCFLNGQLDAYAGDARLLTCQTGNTAPQMFLQISGRPGGGLLFSECDRSLGLRQTDRCRPGRMRSRTLARCRVRGARRRAPAGRGQAGYHSRCLRRIAPQPTRR